MTRDAADIGQEIVDNHLSMRPYPRWSSLVSAIAAAIEQDRAERREAFTHYRPPPSARPQE